MLPGGGCIGWPPLLLGPDLGNGLPPRGGAPDGSIFLRSSLKASSFLDCLSVTRTKRTWGLMNLAMLFNHERPWGTGNSPKMSLPGHYWLKNWILTYLTLSSQPTCPVCLSQGDFNAYTNLCSCPSHVEAGLVLALAPCGDDLVWVNGSWQTTPGWPGQHTCHQSLHYAPSCCWTTLMTPMTHCSHSVICIKKQQVDH